MASIKVRNWFNKDNEAREVSIDKLFIEITNGNLSTKGGLMEYIKDSETIRLIFDLDKRTKTEDEFNEAIKKRTRYIKEIDDLIKQGIPNANMVIARYHGKEYDTKKIEDGFIFKVSDHIHYTNIIGTKKNLKTWIEMIKKQFDNVDGGELSKQIDSSIYDKSGIRLPFARKETLDSRMTLKPLGDATLKDFVLTAWDGEVQEIKPPQQEQPKAIIQKVIQPIKNDKYYELTKVHLDILPIHYATDYKEWLNIGFATYNSYLENGKDLFMEFSKKDPAFSELKFDEDWEHIKKHANKYSTLNKYSIMRKAKKDNPDHEIFDKKADNKKNKNADRMDTHDIIEKLMPDIQDKIIIQQTKDKKEASYYTFNEKLGYWINDLGYCEKLIDTLLIELATEQNNNGLRQAQTRRAVVNDLHLSLRNEEIVFDLKGHLLPFKNGVLNLITGEFEIPKKEDYISIFINYEYHKIENTKDLPLMKVLKQIFPVDEIREYALACSATALIGECIQHIFIQTGCGGNGKGVFNRLLYNALGNSFGINANNALLNEQKTSGSCPAMANLGKKRFVVFKEPDEKRGIVSAVLKELTGGDMITARGHHDSNTEKLNYMSLFIEANTIPKLTTRPDEAEQRRMLIIPFESRFRKEFTKEDIENKRSEEHTSELRSH